MAVPSRPRASMPASSRPPWRLAARPSRVRVSKASWMSRRRLRGQISPKGTTNSKARPQPICVAVMTPPTAPRAMPKSAARASSNGWA